MNIDPTEQLERLIRVSPQRWRLSAGAVAAASIASIVAGASAGGAPPIVLIVVGTLAVVSATRPDTHTALVTMAIVVWQWLVMADDPVGPAGLAVALALFVFHSAIALLAAGSVTTRLDSSILRRWAARLVAVCVATSATWALVVLMDQRNAPGNSSLTIAGLVIALALTAVLLSRVRGGDA